MHRISRVKRDNIIGDGFFFRLGKVRKTLQKVKKEIFNGDKKSELGLSLHVYSFKWVLLTYFSTFTPN